MMEGGADAALSYRVFISLEFSSIPHPAMALRVVKPSKWDKNLSDGVESGIQKPTLILPPEQRLLI